jgi:hypothetical protein
VRESFPRESGVHFRHLRVCICDSVLLHFAGRFLRIRSVDPAEGDLSATKPKNSHELLNDFNYA